MKTLTGLNRVMLCLLLVAASNSTSATEIWSGPTTITGLYPYAQNAFVFNTVYSNTTYSTCDGGKRWMIPKSHENYQSQVAAIMLAFATGKTIDIVIVVLPGACEGTIDRFYIYG
jgi:hypothetical protein